MKTGKQLKLRAKQVHQAGGKLFIVGGAVRDHHMGITPKDVDLCVEGLTIEQCREIFGKFEPIHPHAPVFSAVIGGIIHEVAFCRDEVSTGKSKQDFSFVISSAFIDSLRRDFTFNAMFWDIFGRKLIDFHNGLDDLKNGILRHVSDKFAESPERIFRAAAFVSRFGFVVADETKALIKNMVANGAVSSIPVEQIWNQGFNKIFAGKHIQKAVDFMVECGFAHDTIVAMVNTPQDKKWHPEGNVKIHSCLVAEHMAQNFDSTWGMTKSEAVSIAFAHDMGKIECTFEEDGRVKSPGHADSDTPLNFLSDIGFPVSMMDIASTAIKGHMARFESGSRREVGRWVRKQKNPGFGISLIIADCMGRDSASHVPQSVIDAAAVMMSFEEDNSVTPLVDGNEIMTIRDIKPGKIIGIIKSALIDEQMAGEITTKDQAIQFVKEFVAC